MQNNSNKNKTTTKELQENMNCQLLVQKCLGSSPRCPEPNFYAKPKALSKHQYLGFNLNYLTLNSCSRSIFIGVSGTVTGPQFFAGSGACRQTSIFTTQRQLSDPEFLLPIGFYRCFRNGARTAVFCGLRSTSANINIYDTTSTS